MTVEHRRALSCHASTSCKVVCAIEVLVRRSTSGELRVTYRVDGDIPRFVVTPPDERRIAKELWRHTCFEAFIAMEGQPAYHELNFAPSGEWMVYAFSSYRNGGPVANDVMRPQIVVRSTDSRLELDAVVRLDALSDVHPRTPLRIGLSAIVESSDGLAYWALRHPVGKPDFHNADGFSLLLEPPGSEG
jgi:hypothetical protein